MLAKVTRERDEARETTVHIRNIWFKVFDKLKELKKEKELRIRSEARKDEYHAK